MNFRLTCIEVYARRHRLQWALKQLIATVHRPEVRFRFLGDIEKLLDEARDQGMKVPGLAL